MKNIQDISLDGKRVLIRVDFNVPLDEHFNITDNKPQYARFFRNYIFHDGIMGNANKQSLLQANGIADVFSVFYPIN